MVLDEKLKKEIEELKKDTIILAHNYQIPEIQDAADFVGDSLGLCREAQKADKKYILFAGVDFMAESAALLNPDKIVIVPEKNAMCPMAAMLPAETVKKAKEENPDAAVVLYINTWLEARSEADVIVTSANAVNIIKRIPNKKIIFGPDVNLAWHAQKNLPEKEIIPIPPKGHCRTHLLFKPEQVERARKDHPDAEVLIHPESPPEVMELADHICSTEQMVKRARESSAAEFIIGTEVGLIYRLQKEFLKKKFYPLYDKAICITMKRNTLENFMDTLRNKKNVVEIDPEYIDGALKSLDRMLELSK